MTRIVPLASIGDPLRIEALVRAVHGEGDRAPGWFARKLHRECVDPELSPLAVGSNDEWLGYVLVCSPPNAEGTARTCGAGVIPTMRGRGIGRALFETAASSARAAGFERLHVPAAHERLSFFEHIGFVPVHERATLLAFASGSVHTVTFGTPAPWDAAPERVEHAAWAREPWERTEASSRATLEIDGVHLHLAREGRAVVAHRVCAPPHTSGVQVGRAVDALRQRIVEPTPTLLTGIEPVSEVTEWLLDAGWVVAQRWAVLQRDLRFAR